MGVSILTTVVSKMLLMNLRMLANSTSNLMELIGHVDTKEDGELLLTTDKLHLLEEDLSPSSIPLKAKLSEPLLTTSDIPLRTMSELLISHQNGESLITCSELMSTTQRPSKLVPTVLDIPGIQLRTPDQSETFNLQFKDGLNPQRFKDIIDLSRNSSQLQEDKEWSESGKMFSMLSMRSSMRLQLESLSTILT